MDDNKEMMNIIEITRLQEWLEAYGVPPELREDCVKYIARESDTKIKKETPPPSK